MNSVTPTGEPASRRRLLVFRTGMVLGGLMAVFNTINGIGSLIDPTFGQTDPTVSPQPAWISVMLATFGILTLGAWVPAWRGVRRAIVTVVATRIGEAWSSLALLFLPSSAPDGLVVFVVVLIAVGTVIGLMIAQGLRGLPAGQRRMAAQD